MNIDNQRQTTYVSVEKETEREAGREGQREKRKKIKKEAFQ